MFNIFVVHTFRPKAALLVYEKNTGAHFSPKYPEGAKILATLETFRTLLNFNNCVRQ
jgi:hypothetical protein